MNRYKVDPKDYETYREIIDELIQPIYGIGLDHETLKRLYESKLVYLENLRTKIFYSMNAEDVSFFDVNDYQLVLEAIDLSKKHMKSLVLLAVSDQLAKRLVG